MSDGLRVLHEEIDRETAPLAELHAERLQCGRGCYACCLDGITVFAVEAERIRRNHGDLLKRGRPHGPDACAFLDQHGACRIYEDRPYVCRTQGLPLRWIERDESGELVEYRDICPLNEQGEPAIESLPEEGCWTLGPFESRLAALEHERSAGEPERIALRDLFEKRRRATPGRPPAQRARSCRRADPS